MPSLTEWIQLSGNVVGGLVILWYFLDLLRNWDGSPELKLLKDQMNQTNNHLADLINKL